MAVQHSEVFFPRGFQELFSTWKSLSDAEPKENACVLCAGGIELIRNQCGRIPTLPRKIIFLDKIEELRKISRTERYIEIGCMVRLNKIINLGKIVPEVLTRCLEGIGGPQLRSQVTIGGNICNQSLRMDASAAMVALDALYELRTAQSSRWVLASRFSSMPEGHSDHKGSSSARWKLPGLQDLAPQELLTRIRVPLDPWTYTWYRKFETSGKNQPGGNILFILRNQKDILTDIRVVYSGQSILREKNCESMLSGKRLPLDRKDANAFLEGWQTYLSGLEGDENSNFHIESGHFKPELIKTQILYFIESTLAHISD